MPTHTFIGVSFVAKKHISSILVSLLKGMCGKSKINGFNFILANQNPIKLRGKLKSGLRDH